MRNLCVLTLLVMMSISAKAQLNRSLRPVERGDRFNQPQNTCSVDLEREAWRGSGYQFVESFDGYGRFACEDAMDLCEDEKYSRNFSYEYRCVERSVSRPPRPAPTPETCQYRILDYGRYENESYNGYGLGACREAEQKCESQLKILRVRGYISSRAQCVETTPTRPLPPRYVTASCTVELVAGRIGRSTGHSFDSTAQASSYTEARDRACLQATTECEAMARGTMRCEVVR